MQLTPPSPELRAADPAFAAMVDHCIDALKIAETYTGITGRLLDTIAGLRAEVATLKAQLSSSRSAA